MKNVMGNCDKCDEPIEYGEAYVSFSRSIEKTDYNFKTSEDEAEVIQSEELLILCGHCGNSFSGETICQIIKAIPLDDSKIAEN